MWTGVRWVYLEENVSGDETSVMSPSDIFSVWCVGKDCMYGPVITGAAYCTCSQLLRCWHMHMLILSDVICWLCCQQLHGMPSLLNLCILWFTACMLNYEWVYDVLTKIRAALLVWSMKNCCQFAMLVITVIAVARVVVLSFYLLIWMYGSISITALRFLVSSIVLNSVQNVGDETNVSVLALHEHCPCLLFVMSLKCIKCRLGRLSQKSANRMKVRYGLDWWIRDTVGCWFSLVNEQCLNVIIVV